VENKAFQGERERGLDFFKSIIILRKDRLCDAVIVQITPSKYFEKLLSVKTKFEVLIIIES